MRFYITNFRWVMLVAGLLTCSMFLGLFSPQSSLQSNFGTSLDGAAANIIVRNWAALIGLMGIMLIYGAFVPAARSFALVIAGLSKIIFISLVLSSQTSFMDHGAGIAVIADSVMVLLFTIYLVLNKR